MTQNTPSRARAHAEDADRIRAAHAAGSYWSAIARDLTADGVPTAQNGARW